MVHILALSGVLWLNLTSTGLHQEGKPASSLRLALVSSTPGENINNLLDLAQAKLSGEPRLEILERKAIQKILAEQKLSLAGLVDSSLAVQAGKLLSANVFALIETDPQGKEALGLVIYDAETGIKWYDQTLAAGTLDQQVEAIAQAVRGVAKKRAAGSQSGRTLCILGARNADLPRSQDHVASTVAWLLERHLLTSSSLAVLDRKRLDWVNKEKNLTSTTKELLASLVTVDVEISRAEKGIKTTVYLTDSQGKALGKIKAESKTANPEELVKGLLAGMVQTLQVTSSGAAPDRLRESQRFFQEGRRLVSHQDWQPAIQAFEAGYALDAANGEIRNDLAKALISWASRAMPPGYKAKSPSAELVKQILAGGARAYELRRFSVQEAGATLAGLRVHNHTFRETNHHLTLFGMPLYQKEFLDEECRDLGQQVFAAFVQMAKAELDQWARATKETPTISPEYMTVLSNFLGEIKNANYLFKQELEPISLAWLVQWREVNQTPDLSPYYVNQLFNPLADHTVRFIPFYESLTKHAHPLVRLWGRYFLLSVRRHQGQIAGAKAEQAFQEIKRAALQTIEKYQPPAEPLTYAGHDLRHGCYWFLMDISQRWYAANPEAGFNERFALCDFMLRRKEIANHPFLETVRKDPNGQNPFHRPRLQLIEKAQVLLAAGIPDLCTEPDDLRNELASIRQGILEERPDLVDSKKKEIVHPALKTLRLLVRLDEIPGLDQLGQPLIQGEHILLPISRHEDPENAFSDIWLEVLKVSWKDKGKFQKWGQWKLPAKIPGERNLFGIQCRCWGDGRLFVGTRFGIFAFSEQGQVEVVHKDFDLPALATRALVYQQGKLYACLDDGYFLALDLKTKKYETLASSRRRERLSPFDDSEIFRVQGLLTDPPRDRLLLLLYQRPNVPGFYGPNKYASKDTTHGLWEYNLKTQKFTRHLELVNDVFNLAYTVEPGHWLLSHTGFDNVLDFDLITNKAQILLGSGLVSPSLFHHSVPRQQPPAPPFYQSCWKHEGYLWAVDWWLLAKISLKDGRVENIPGLPVLSSNPRFHGWCGMERVDSRRLVMQNLTGLWLLELPE